MTTKPLCSSRSLYVLIHSLIHTSILIHSFIMHSFVHFHSVIHSFVHFFVLFFFLSISLFIHARTHTPINYANYSFIHSQTVIHSLSFVYLCYTNPFTLLLNDDIILVPSPSHTHPNALLHFGCFDFYCFLLIRII